MQANRPTDADNSMPRAVVGNTEESKPVAVSDASWVYRHVLREFRNLRDYYQPTLGQALPKQKYWRKICEMTAVRLQYSLELVLSIVNDNYGHEL